MGITARSERTGIGSEPSPPVGAISSWLPWLPGRILSSIQHGTLWLSRPFLAVARTNGFSQGEKYAGESLIFACVLRPATASTADSNWFSF